MKRIRKDRILLIGVIAIAIIAVVVLVVVNPFKKPPVEEPAPEIYELPDTTYSNMEVKNVEMEYLRDNNETMVSMDINNTTDRTVEKEDLDALWLNADGEVLGQIETYIDKLAPGEQINVSVILQGDLTSTVAIKLQEK